MTFNCSYLGTLFILSALGSIGEATLYLDEYCGETISVHGDHLESQSSKNYRDHMNCRVTIKAPYEYQIVTLDWDWIDLYNRYCNDYIKVYDTDGSLMEKFCGKANPEDMYSSGESIDIHMVTDNRYSDRGFSLVFTAIHDAAELPCNDTSKFLCSNDRCIDSSLVCDGNNNCNTDSDEDGCPHEVNEPENNDEVNVGLIIFVVFTVIAVILVIIVAVRSHMKKKKQRKANTNVIHGQPPVSNDSYALQPQGGYTIPPMTSPTQGGYALQPMTNQAQGDYALQPTTNQTQGDYALQSTTNQAQGDYAVQSTTNQTTGDSTIPPVTNETQGNNALPYGFQQDVTSYPLAPPIYETIE